MLTTRTLKWLLGAAGAWPATALAHSFGRSYNLPVPVWMYVYGAASALALSFVLIAWFATEWQAESPHSVRTLRADAATLWLRRLHVRPVLRAATLAGLLLAIATGLWGTLNPYTNFGMTWFWILFVLGFGYLSVLAGDIYRVLNPWAALTAIIGRVWPRAASGVLIYPERLGSWPALAGYMGFVWLELFGELGPRGLGRVLLAYTALNIAGVALIGTRAWFRHCEFFGVMFRLLAHMAPLDHGPGRPLHARTPCAGLIGTRLDGYALLLFVLFMLSSTAFDGLRVTAPWAKLFWVDIYALLQPWAGADPVAAYRRLQPWHVAWETAALLLSPLFYLAAYLLCIAVLRRITGTRSSLRDLALLFAPSLLPIALAYNVAHYLTLFLAQGPKILALISDPFGWHWNLLGTAGWLRTPWVPDAGLVWHMQVAVIVGGHVISVYLAHLAAFAAFGGRRLAAVSQLPMLALMMLFTGSGLWILAQPIGSG